VEVEAAVEQEGLEVALYVRLSASPRTIGEPSNKFNKV
jgi:hypothetical protein